MSGNAYKADQLKEQGNQYFKEGNYEKAEECYSQAIQKYSQNPLLFTNRAFARLKLQQWNGVIDDCLRSIELLPDNMKAYFYLAQAQLAINHPNEALSSALRAYELCLKTNTSSAAAIASLVLKCKKTKWEARERERLRRKNELLSELEDALEQSKHKELSIIREKEARGEIDSIDANEEREALEESTRRKQEDLRSTFALADPTNMERREVPDYLIDLITFEIMHDPAVAKSGHSYERATITEHLKRSPTDPLTREPMTINELRSNENLKQACNEFLEKNAGWAVDW